MRAQKICQFLILSLFMVKFELIKKKDFLHGTQRKQKLQKPTIIISSCVCYY